MRRFRGVRAALLGAGIALVSPALAQAPATAPKSKAAAKAEDALDPDATAALDAMGRYLRSLKTFQVEATASTDDVLEDGQVLQAASDVNMVVRAPDRLILNVDRETGQRLYLYDGKSVTAWDRTLDFYATVPAPPTLGQLADTLEDEYGIELPLVDLFRWGAPGRTQAKLTSAIDVGPSDVDGTSCEHYAFRQEGLDWQVWIQKGDFPLPRKLVLTTTTDDARPRHTAVLTWNLAPAVNDQAFVFRPTPTAKKVVLAELPSTKGTPASKRTQGGSSK